MKKIIIRVVNLVLATANCFTGGMVVLYGFNIFIAKTFELPEIGIFHAIGIGLLVSYLTRTVTGKRYNTRKMVLEITKDMLYVVVFIALGLIIG